MRDLNKELVEAEKAVVEGKKVLRAEKRKLKKDQGEPIESKNAKRALKSIKQGVELAKERRNCLEDQEQKAEA
jgi:hypothetical protein